MAPEDAPATKRDLRELEERLEERMIGMEGRMIGMEGRMTSMEERLLESMRDMQTEILKVFLPAQEQNRSRYDALEARQSGVEARTKTVEARLWEIEKKLLLNPPAA